MVIKNESGYQNYSEKIHLDNSGEGQETSGVQI
jgi:hypothetical protein